LRLRWAVEAGWEPGLWRADQISGDFHPPAKPKQRFRK
jgi:hypothetical protein